MTTRKDNSGDWGMKLSVFLIIFAAVVSGYGRSDLDKMVGTERSFAQWAAEKGTKSAFLEFAAKDAVLFLPDRVNAREHWTARGQSTGLLSWAPNFADMSANGLMGYTTGNWEFRPKGKEGAAAGYGEFITIWLRQSDGNYRFVVDIGIGHEPPKVFSTNLANVREGSRDLHPDRRSAADSANTFYQSIYAEGLAKAYESFASGDIRAFREGAMPIVGKKDLVSNVKKDTAKYDLAKRSTFFETADLAYNTNTYRKLVDGKVVEKGNTLQIWKLSGGKWRLVLDVFKPVP
jgi:hypothetical protein